MGILGGTIETPRDLYLHKLGAALTMEKTIMDMLPKLQEQANDAQLEQALAQHLDETRGHVAALERAFAALGADVDQSACPVIEALEKEGESNLKMVDEALNDQVILSGVCETEHHEIAVYEGLITNAEAMGASDVAALLGQILQNEKATLEKAMEMGTQLARSAPQAA
jgi:ferritin-like metal-binding protein YciE